MSKCLVSWTTYYALKIAASALKNIVFPFNKLIKDNILMQV